MDAPLTNLTMESPADNTATSRRLSRSARNDRTKSSVTNNNYLH